MLGEAFAYRPLGHDEFGQGRDGQAGIGPMQQPPRIGAVEEALKSVSPIKLNGMPSLSNVRCAPIDSPYQNGSGTGNCKLAAASPLRREGRPVGRAESLKIRGKDVRQMEEMAMRGKNWAEGVSVGAPCPSLLKVATCTEARGVFMAFIVICSAKLYQKNQACIRLLPDAQGARLQTRTAL